MALPSPETTAGRVGTAVSSRALRLATDAQKGHTMSDDTATTDLEADDMTGARGAEDDAPEPDAPEPDAPEPDADAAAPPKSQADIEAITEKLAREGDRHAKRVAEIMGDDFALLVPSPIDWTPGFLFNAPGMLPFPEQLAELDALVGRGSADEYREAPDAEPCETCNALGDVLTGSRKPGQEVKMCPDCQGAGWRVKAPALAAATPLPTAAGGFSVAAPPPNAIQVADRWGRPFGHPHYGLEPASVPA